MNRESTYEGATPSSGVPEGPANGGRYREIKWRELPWTRVASWAADDERSENDKSLGPQRERACHGRETLGHATAKAVRTTNILSERLRQ